MSPAVEDEHSIVPMAMGVDGGGDEVIFVDVIGGTELLSGRVMLGVEEEKPSRRDTRDAIGIIEPVMFALPLVALASKVHSALAAWFCLFRSGPRAQIGFMPLRVFQIMGGASVSSKSLLF